MVLVLYIIDSIDLLICAVESSADIQENMIIRLCY